MKTFSPLRETAYASNRRIARFSARRGFSLVEIILASALLSIIVTGVSGALIYSQESTTLAGKRSRAVLLAEEGFEAARNMRDAGFGNLADGAHGLAISNNQWAFTGLTDTTDIFTRSLSVASTTIEEKRRKIATSTVIWSETPMRSGAITFETYFTDWRRSFADWTAPTVEATSDTPGADNANEIALYSKSGIPYAVIVRNAGPNDELYIFNVSDPASPVQIGSIGLNGAINDIAVTENYAVLASTDNSEELQVIDLSPIPSGNPTLAGALDLPGITNALSVAASGTSVFLGRAASPGDQEVYSISIATPSSPSLLDLTPLELGTGADALKISLAQNNQYLYVASVANSSELFIVSVSDPVNLSVAGAYDASGNVDGTAVAAFSTYAALGRADGNILIINAVTPSTPTLVNSGSPLDIGGTVWDLAMGVGDIYTFAATNTAGTPTKVVNLSNPALPALLGSVSQSGDTKGVVWDFDLNRAFTAGTDNSAELAVIRPN